MERLKIKKEDIKATFQDCIELFRGYFMKIKNMNLFTLNTKELKEYWATIPMGQLCRCGIYFDNVDFDFNISLIFRKETEKFPFKGDSFSLDNPIAYNYPASVTYIVDDVLMNVVALYPKEIINNLKKYINEL